MSSKSPSKKQLKHEQSERKRGIVNLVTESALHIIHESHLFGSTLWPTNDIIIGDRREDFIDDRIYIIVNARIPFLEDHDRLLGIIIHSRDVKRIKEQAKVIDTIFDSAVYGDVTFTVYNSSKLAEEFRYSCGGIGNIYQHYINLRYTFTFKIN